MRLTRAVAIKRFTTHSATFCDSSVATCSPGDATTGLLSARRVALIMPFTLLERSGRGDNSFFILTVLLDASNCWLSYHAPLAL